MVHADLSIAVFGTEEEWETAVRADDFWLPQFVLSCWSTVRLTTCVGFACVYNAFVALTPCAGSSAPLPKQTC